MIARSPMTLVNAVGCVLLVVVCVMQWREIAHWQGLHAGAQDNFRREEAQRIEAQRRQGALEGDVSLLKDSLQRMEEKIAQSEAALATAQRRTLDVQKDLEHERQSHATQIENWQRAVQQRDEQQAALQKQLQEARRRLDEAIAAMKKSVQTP
jgi:predicted  nucleic acid-binding Zn-ribbon protein